MSIQLKIAEPQDGASEVATATRESLQQWIESVQDKCADEWIKALSPDQTAHQVSRGRELYTESLEDPQRVIRCADGLYNAIRALVHALDRAICGLADDPRSASYRVEGVMRAFAKSMFENQWSFTPMHRRVYMDLMSGGAFCNGLSYANTVRFTGGGDLTILPMIASVFGCRHAFVYGFEAQCIEQRRISDLLSDEQFEYLGLTHTLHYSTGHFVVPVGYMDEDGPWVAGFLSPDDTARYRFSRKRLGAWLKDSGAYTDEQVRYNVEAAKAQNSGGSFVIYPNDVLFGGMYVAGRGEVSSCMASPADDYSTWDGIHPCDAYSTAYHGVGDNGLALITAEGIDGNIVGRGIWNCGTKKVVRWYGDETKFRALSKLGMLRCTEALQGSYLAYLNSGSKFIAPYIDGDIEYGKVDADNGRVYLDNHGINLSETSGVVGIEHVYCIDDDEYHDRDDCTYQPEHNTWVWDADYVDWQCAVTSEYVRCHNRDTIWLDGEEAEVSERVTGRCNQYLREIPPTLEMYEWAKDNEVEVPTNYEAK